MQHTLHRQFLCGMWHTRTIHRWKIQLETIPSMYSTFAAELIQPPFRQLTFAHVRHCSPDYTVDSMYITHTTHGNHARTRMVLRNQDSSDPKLNVVLRGKEFCVVLRWVFVESCSGKFTIYANGLSLEGVLHSTVLVRVSNADLMHTIYTQSLCENSVICMEI